MAFDFDDGPGGAEGPWIAWSARGTQDGEIPAKSFYIRDGDEKTATKAFAKGVVLDIENMKTGWQKSEGIAGKPPEWQWNDSLTIWRPRPDEDYKKGFSIRCAITADQSATWEQAGAGAWNAFTGIASDLKTGSQANPGKLPMVKMTDTKLEKFTRGSTVTPVLEIAKWVARPECLTEGFEVEVADEPEEDDEF